MTRTKTEIALFLALLAGAANAASPDAAATAEAEVRDRLDHCIVALNNLDLTGFTGCFADDVTLFNPDIPDAKTLHRLDGRAAVAAHMRGMFDNERQKAKGPPPYLHVQPRNVRVQLGASTAIVSFEFDRGQGQFGRRTLVFEKRGAEWLIIHLHASNVNER